LESVDGLLLTGGGDLAPQLFNGKRHPQVYGVSVDRDAFEIQAVRAAITKRLPILGICRGCQALNVALGGSLFTHITTQKLNALIHDQNESEPRDRFSHTVKIEKTSLLADILGSLTVQVNSLHHQGIDKIGEGLHITARAPDGLVEAVEIDNYPFGVAVQWHPEWLHAYPEQRRLFEAYIHAAEVYHQGRRKAVRYDQTHRCF
jgi:putative glutamine amidotransferase